MLQVLPCTNEPMCRHAASAAIVDQHATVNLYLSLVLTACHTLELEWVWRILTLMSTCAGMLLVDTQMKTLRRPAALSDFLQCQEGHLGDVVDALRSDWLLKVAHPS